MPHGQRCSLCQLLLWNTDKRRAWCRGGESSIDFRQKVHPLTLPPLPVRVSKGWVERDFSKPQPGRVGTWRSNAVACHSTQIWHCQVPCAAWGRWTDLKKDQRKMGLCLWACIVFQVRNISQRSLANLPLNWHVYNSSRKAGKFSLNFGNEVHSPKRGLANLLNKLSLSGKTQSLCVFRIAKSK